MACDGIGILQLQGIIIFILTYSLISLLLGSKVGIILIDTLIKQIGLLIGQRCALRLQCIQYHLGNDLLIVIVRE